MKNVIIAILVAIVLVFAFLFFTQKKSNVAYEPWPETEPAHTTTTNNNNSPVQPSNPVTNSSECNSSSSPSITVVSPNGGEAYYKNEAIDLKWKSCNVAGNVHLNGQFVGISNPSGSRTLFCEGGSSTWGTENCLNSQGGRMVTPGVNFWESGTYKLKLTSRDEGIMVSDSSNGTFTISPSSAPNSVFQDSGNDVNGTHAGYIKSVSNSGGNYSLKIDYVVLGSCPGDECITNNNSLIRTFPISSNATIKAFNSDWQQVDQTQQQFANSFSNETAYELNWITLNNGVVVEIKPHYLP